MQQKLAIPACIAESGRRIALLHFDDRAAINPGAHCAAIWIVKQGYVKLHRVSVQGRQVTLSVLGQGAMFGTLEGDLSTVAAIASAHGAVQAYRIELAKFDELLANDTEFSRYVARALSRRNDALQRRLYYLMHRKVAPRLAAVLSDLVKCEGGPCVHGADVDVRLTQQDLADMVGAARQVVSSALNRLRERKVLEYSRDFICIRDMTALTALAEDEAASLSER